MRIAIGSDHAGFKAKAQLEDWLRTPKGGSHQILDLGTGTEESCDYPDFAGHVAKAVAEGRADKGLLFCGTGIGMAMAANKIDGIRAAVVWDPVVASLAVEHNDANVLCLPARFLTQKKAQGILKSFFTAKFEGGRHLRRVKKITALEK